MQLFGEIGKNLLGDVMPCGRCLFYAGGGGYFQGVKSFDDFSQKGITLHFTGGDLVVSGERLSVGKYRAGDLELRGRIFSLSFYKKGMRGGAGGGLNAEAGGGNGGKERGV